MPFLHHFCWWLKYFWLFIVEGTMKIVLHRTCNDLHASSGLIGNDIALFAKLKLTGSVDKHNMTVDTAKN